MRKSIFGLLANDFTDWHENEVGSVTEIVTDLTQLTPLANKLLGGIIIGCHTRLYHYESRL